MRKALITIPLLLVLAFACAFAFRMSYATIWEEKPERAMLNGSPLLLNMDGYYYLRMAKQIQQDTYDTLDEKSEYPQGAARRAIPPLLASLTAWLSSTFSLTLERAALLLPAIMGSLVIIPIFFLGRAYGGNFMGFFAAVFAGLAPGLIQRSAYGFFDTDGGNVFFAAACAALFMQFGSTKNWKRYLWFLSGMLTYVVFLLWWDQTIEGVTAFAFLPILAAMLVEYRPQKREATAFISVLLLIVVAAVFLLGYVSFESSMDRITETVSYIQKETHVFPVPSLFVGEQQQLGIGAIAEMTMGSIPGFILGLLGIALLIWKMKWRIAYLAGFFAIGTLTFTSMRFVIFLIPLLALGFACLFNTLWRQDSHQSLWRLISIGALVLVVLLQTMSFYGMKSGTIPASHPGITRAMAILPDHTPEESVVWTNWNLAYPLMYYSDRATIVDGQSRTPLMYWVVSVPYACKTQRQSANWMQFYITHGKEGLDIARNMFGGSWAESLPRLLELLAMGPDTAREDLRMVNTDANDIERILAFLFPVESTPIYMLTDHRTMHSSWYTIGQWDFSQNSGELPSITLFTSAIIQENSIKALAFSINNMLTADLDKGVAGVGDATYLLERYEIYDDASTDVRMFPNDGYILGLNVEARGGALSSPQILDTTLYELLIKSQGEEPYFRKIFGEPTMVQFWEVQSDHYNE